MSRVLALTVRDHSKRMLAINSLQTQIDRILSNTSISKDGRDWLVRALHPAAPCERLVGVPDGAVRMSTVPELLREITITAPGAVNWDCLVVTLNSDTVGALVFTRNSGAAWKFYDAALPYSGTSDSKSATVLKTGFYDVFGTDSGSLATGIGYTLATRIRDAALVPIGIDDCRTTDDPSVWRTAAASTTVYMTASALYNGGTVTAGNFNAFQGVSTDAYALVNPPGLTAVATGRVFACAARADFQIPFETSEMLALNPACYVAPASEGVYIPCSFRNFDLAVSPPRTRYTSGLFTAGTQWWTNVGGTSGCYSVDPLCVSGQNPSTGGSRMVDSFYRRTDVAKSGDIPERNGFSAFQSRALAAGAGGFDLDKDFVCGLSTGVDGRETSVILFTGLSASASLTVKTVNVQELVPNPGSASSEYIRRAPDRDTLALSLYQETRSRMPQGFPASFNSLGLIMGAIKAALPVVLPHLVGLANSVISRVSRPREVAPPPPGVVSGGRALPVDGAPMGEARERRAPRVKPVVRRKKEPKRMLRAERSQRPKDRR